MQSSWAGGKSRLLVSRLAGPKMSVLVERRMSSARLTEDMPTPIRTPRERTIHQNPAPTRPAAPVPEAKYLHKYVKERTRKR